MSRLTMAAIGCGHRTRTYVGLGARQPDRYRTVAAADPVRGRVEATARLARNPDFAGFASAEELLARPPMADLMIIGSQDAHHREHAVAAMERGYHLLLEKPIATNLKDVLSVEATARKLGRKVLVCHVLRYAPLYRKIKEIVDSGLLGELVTINAFEGVGAWHQAHSYVRGHWAVTEKASPMILAKSCHDLDILRWIADRRCLSVASAGALTHFTPENAPEGAPARCQDGCPVADTCHYNCIRYLGEERGWLANVCDLSGEADDATVAEWLHRSPWGRCVYRCDNTAVDHQVAVLSFERGLTATFTMTAFENGRHLDLFGTRAKLKAGGMVKEAKGHEIMVRFHDKSMDRYFDSEVKEGGYAGHGGGDSALMEALHEEMQKERPEDMTSSLQNSVESHRMAFAAEEARLSGRVVPIPVPPHR